MKNSFIFSALLSLVLGLAIAWIDARPNWDDTGISVLMVLTAAFLCGYLAAKKPWLIALLVSSWIPLLSILTTQNLGALLALIPGFIGAYAGYLIKKTF